MVRDPIDSFIDAYVQALHDQNAAIFAGAGLSIPAGLVNWKELLKDIASDIGLDVTKEDDLITLAQFHVNERGGRHRINQALIDEFSGRAKSSDKHKLLTALPIRTYWTTNYDALLEESLRAAGKTPDVKITVENLATTAPRRDAVVYKMHGDVSLPDKAVVTKDDYESYESYESTRHLFSTALQGDLVSKTFLFIGFSFNDPNLSYILSRIRILLGENRREHYCLLRRVQRGDFKKAADFHYARAKQDLQVRDLRRYGILGLLVDDYTHYTNVLKRISSRYNLARVFISGSAADYSPWDEGKAQELIHAISRGLIRDGFGVVSGFGVGVGPHVVNGVLEQLETERTQMLDDRLILRPFPVAISDTHERKRRWTAYRKDMLQHAGVALFLFGNRANPAGGVVSADGMEEEFRLAVARGLFVVPAGCTGGMAKTLHSKVLDAFDEYYPLHGYRRMFEALGRPGTPNQVAKRILDLLTKLREDKALPVAK
jgi:Sir2- and TIR-associating SLOG family/SIR2-like domain